MRNNKMNKENDIYKKINERLNLELFDLNENILENNKISPKFVNEIKNVIFIYKGCRYNFICDENELLYLLIEKFKERTGTKNLNFLFLNNGRQLNPIIGLNQFNSRDIKIDVCESHNLSGGQSSIKFTDISKQIYEEHYFSDTAPSYRIVMQGINIYGICKNKKCIAFNEEVIVPLHNKKRFDLIEEKYDLECPECNNIIMPKTVGFYLCNYKIKGVKYQDDKKISFEFEGQAPKRNCIQYFNPDKNGETTMVKLIIEVTEYLI